MVHSAALFTLAILSATQHVVASPTRVLPDRVPARVLHPRATITASPPASMTPDITDHGSLDQNAIDQLLASLLSSAPPKPTATTNATNSPLKARQTAAPARGLSSNGAFLSYYGGVPDSDKTNCSAWSFEGPIIGMEATMGSSNFRGLKLTGLSGNTTDIAGGLETVVAPGPFSLAANERFTEFIVWETPDVQVSGFTFKTDAGQSYEALSSITQNPANTFTKTSLPVGSGMIARMYGTMCSVGIMGNLGIDFLDELASISITNMTYSGFTNNLAPTAVGSQFSVGSQILDNRNSSIQQQMTLTTANAVTQSRTITTGSTWSVGGSVAAEAEVGMPFIAKTKVTTTATWSVGGSSDTQELTSETKTTTAAFPLSCPAKKYCIANASFMMFKIDVNAEATFTAKTKAGSSYSWVQKAEYKGQDSAAMQLTVDEANGA
ncbi:hypothetical protein BP6252_08972 [Coleophoma cylindrospora]|uniref:Uncharacterized protein n=1 Tax=Coleophoma cylindrospora TaxID=1849047 RepID=A0A3D8R0L8_9HELO|nr:hypothetical protein BP6252_08972 [Coleophoma cylindrospora]